MMQPEDGKIVLLTGNDQLDRKIGGIPLPTLALVEGGNDTGKSVFVQQITYGALQQGYTVSYITTENTARSLITQMESLSYKVLPHYLKWQFYITSILSEGINWNKKAAKFFLYKLLKYISDHKNEREIFVVDSLSQIVTYAEEEMLLAFFSRVRRLVDTEGVTIFMTMHPFALDKDLMGRIRSIFDAHFVITIKEMGEKVVRVIDVAKLRGAKKVVDNKIGFTVDPVFGIRVIPFSSARG